MNKPKKESYASDEDLDWFKIENYSEVRGKDPSDFADSAASVATYRQWAGMLRDRVELGRFLDAGETDYVAEHFEKLKVDPLTHLGFSQSYGGGTHPANTATVRAITANRVWWLNDAMVGAGAEGTAIVDVLLASETESVFADYAHLTINLRATNQQIRNDFARWLMAWRVSTPKVTQGDYQNKINRWASSHLLAYIDLDLFSRTTGYSISQHRAQQMLFPRHTVEQYDALRRKLDDAYELACTDDMAKIIAHLAQSE